MTDANKALDAIVVGAGFAGIYMLHRLRQQGLNAKVIEAGVLVWVVPGIGTVILVHAATFRACNILISFLKNYSKNGSGAKSTLLREKS